MNGIFTPVFQHYTTNEIKPSGWLRRQLEIQAQGLSGHLDKVWPDVRDSAWIGGDREGWERVPYWLDGFVPLAYLLEDEDLIARAKKYIDHILAQQCEDGWICPCPVEKRLHYDLWAVLLISKVLMVYGECSGDSRAEEAAYRALKHLQHFLKGTNTLCCWGQYRWFEGLLPLQWLYAKRPEDWMIDLAVTLRSQGADYEALFDSWRDQLPRREWSYQTHIVNLAMAMKSEAVYSGISGKTPGAFAEKMLARLTESHGSAVGHILGDECLAGRSPIHGTELCAVAEAMYSYEILSEITGNPVWMDRTEVLAFNSFPATNSEDMWTHQYLQLENQIACAIQQDPPVYGTNAAESNVFGLEPNFGCCTANLHQAWPKLTLSTFLRTEKGILSAVLAPAELTTQVDGRAVRVRLETDYPFGDTLRYVIECEEPAAFAFSLRIPGFAASAEVEGRRVTPGQIYTIERVWQGHTEVMVKLHFEPEWIARPNDLWALRRGPLFYALPVEAREVRHEYVRDNVERKFPYCDVESFPVSEWRYAFTHAPLALVENGVGERPFSRSQPPLQLETTMARIDWGTLPGQPNVCAETPESLEKLGEDVVRLQPYGCTTLRMTVMPRVE